MADLQSSTVIDEVLKLLTLQQGSNTLSRQMLLDSPMASATAQQEQRSAAFLNSRECASLRSSLLEISSLKNFQAQQHIFLEGQSSHYCYYLYSGMLRIYQSSDEGRERTLHFITPGCFFAEGLLFQAQGKTYPGSAEVLAKACCLQVQKEGLARLSLQYPQMQQYLTQSIAEKLRVLNQQISSSLGDLEDSLIKYLEKEAQRQGASAFTLPIAKKHLAHYLGCNPESLSRLLHRLESEGRLKLEGRKILLKV